MEVLEIEIIKCLKILYIAIIYEVKLLYKSKK